MHAHRGNKVCSNALLVSQAVLETQLLKALQTTVFNPAVVNYTLRSFEQRLVRHIKNQIGETGALEARIADLERKIRNCTIAIAEGHAFKSLLDQIALMETEMRVAKERLESARAEGLAKRMRDTRRFVETSLGDLQMLLNRNPKLARAGLAKHARKITLTPKGGAYVATGEWHLLGLVSYGGAGGPEQTERHIPFTIKVAA